MIIFRCFLVIALMGWSFLACAAEVKTEKSADGWRLLVDGKPFFIKGMVYAPAAIGESPDDNTLRNWETVDDKHDDRNDYAYKTWVDVNRDNKRTPDEKDEGDFELMHQMGVNAIRIYNHMTADPQLQKLNGASSNMSNYPSDFTPAQEQKLLRDLYYKYHIMVAMGDFLGSYTINTGTNWDAGTDYTDPVQRKNMLRSVEEMARRYKDEPYLLMWVLGAENNLQEFTHTNARQQPEAYAKLVNEAALLIKKIDHHRHPVTICNGNEDLIEYYAKYAPAIDIFGSDKYTFGGFYELWSKVAAIYDRPVMLTEFGLAEPLVVNGMLDEGHQARAHKLAWEDIALHRAGRKAPGNAIGGFVFEWVDNWWEDGDKWHQNVNPNGRGWNHEYMGVTSMGDGTGGSLERQLNKVFWVYKELWKKD